MRVPVLLRNTRAAALQRECELHGLVAYEFTQFHMQSLAVTGECPAPSAKMCPFTHIALCMPVSKSPRARKKKKRVTHTLCSYVQYTPSPREFFQYCGHHSDAQQARRLDESATNPSVPSTMLDAQLRGLYTGGTAPGVRMICKACRLAGTFSRCCACDRMVGCDGLTVSMSRPMKNPSIADRPTCRSA